jgi:hypothetical protein
VVHTCNTNTWEAEAGGWRVGGQPELHSETLTQTNRTRQKQAKQKPTEKNTETCTLKC